MVGYKEKNSTLQEEPQLLSGRQTGKATYQDWVNHQDNFWAKSTFVSFNL
jgi:hypothetical protein